MSAQHTPGQLVKQRSIAEKQLAGEQALLARLPGIHEDVRANHERVIRMRIAHYEKRIADISAAIAKAAQ